ncbi:MAG: hypothetical protein KF774_09085 [Planctomyces sp.]|nr:hypothetical protein [Planctomyces sp.]
MSMLKKMVLGCCAVAMMMVFAPAGAMPEAEANVWRRQAQRNYRQFNRGYRSNMRGWHRAPGPRYGWGGGWRGGWRGGWGPRRGVNVGPVGVYW